MPIEVEARFGVTDPGALEHLAGLSLLGGAAVGPPNAVEEIDEYLDTEDGALAAARWACRLRRRGDTVVVSLKGPPGAGTGAWLHRRPEVEGPADSQPVPEGWPPSEARDLLDRLRAGRPLTVRLTLRQHRVERLVAAGAERVGLVSIDDVLVVHRGDEVGRFGIVELELAADGDEGLMRAAAADLASVPGLAAEPRSKLERAIEMIGAG